MKKSPRIIKYNKKSELTVFEDYTLIVTYWFLHDIGLRRERVN